MQKDLLTHIMQLSARCPKWHRSLNFYFAVASILALVGFCFCAMANDNHVIKYAPNSPYDNIPITPRTWEEVDLIYYSTISAHRYTNSIQLLRPIAWLHKRHMDIIGSKVRLSMPEFGIVDVLTTVKAIKPTKIDTRGVDWSKQKSAPVIGKFMRYVNDVRIYTFKDSLGHISHINATPNHPFYAKNKHGFVSIGNVSDDDTLVGAVGSGDKHIDGAVHLVCAKGKNSHCGTAFGGVGLPVYVYNFEVYKRHAYQVGSGRVLVHNGCTRVEKEEYAAKIIQNSWRTFQEKSPKFKYDPIALRYIPSNKANILIGLDGNIIGNEKDGYLIESITGWFSSGRVSSPTTRETVDTIFSQSTGVYTELRHMFPQNTDDLLPFYADVLDSDDSEISLIDEDNISSYGGSIPASSFTNGEILLCPEEGCEFRTHDYSDMQRHLQDNH